MLKPLGLVGGVFMIYTITFNPAVDYVVTADTFRTGKTNRTKTENIVFGGKGVGLMNMIMYAILGVFIFGLMIGRTPVYLGKKIEGREMKLTALCIIIHPLLILADEPTGALDSHSSQMLLSTIQSINEDLGATILMVTHDAFSASYANRILFLRDGAIFTEIRKGGDSRRTFFEKILDVLTMMGGGMNDVR